MRTIGIDLAIIGKHQATIMNEHNQQVGQRVTFGTDPQALDDLLQQARRGAAADEPLQAVMEPTGSIWLPVASYLMQRQVTAYLVNTQYTARLQKADYPRGKSDRTSADLLARLPAFNPRLLHPLALGEAPRRAGQRFARQRERLTALITAQQNRIQALERTFWPGLERVVKRPLAPWMRAWRERWYDPQLLLSLEATTLAQELFAWGAPVDMVDQLAQGLQQVAQDAVRLYDLPSAAIDYQALQEEVLGEQRLLTFYEAERERLERRIRALHHQLDPQGLAQSLMGVGEQGAAVYTFFVGDAERFPSQRQFRSWSGMCPRSSQSGAVEANGLGISKAGPKLIKKYAYLNAEIARQWDPQIAAIYYDQMMHKGKHHTQAVCCCATHLLDRVRAVLRSGTPYQLRDVDGRPIDKKAARAIVLERYHVPKEIRQRRTRRRRGSQAKGQRQRSRSRQQEASQAAASS